MSLSIWKFFKKHFNAIKDLFCWTKEKQASITKKIYKCVKAIPLYLTLQSYFPGPDQFLKSPHIDSQFFHPIKLKKIDSISGFLNCDRVA